MVVFFGFSVLFCWVDYRLFFIWNFFYLFGLVNIRFGDRYEIDIKEKEVLVWMSF